MRLTRRVFVEATGVGLSAVGLGGYARAADSGLTVVDPRVDYIDRPLGLEELRPRFSWCLRTTGRNIRQLSYRLRVASTAQLLAAETADLWDSGRVASGDSFGIPYGGPALRSRQRCYWSVEVFDNRGQTATSEVSWWEMGLLSAADWTAAWVNVEDTAGKAYRLANGGKPLKDYPAQPAMLLRRKFSVDKTVAFARLYATALGAYEAHINGRVVGNRKLAPELTDYRKRVLYQTYDVTELVKSGENVLGGLVGDGWYGSPYSYWPIAYMFGPPPRRFFAQLELHYSDGSKDVIATDTGWRMTPSAILSSQLYAGETYDARKELPGWDAVGFDDTGWAPVEIGDAPKAVLAAQVDPPIREVMTLEPVGVTTPKPDTYVFDFGQNFAGWARLKVKGPAGAAVTMRFAEILKPSGEVDQSNLRTAKATDTYILRGDPSGETYEPHFTYHGFRYVEVTGLPGTARSANLTGIVIQTDLAITGQFRVGNPVIQKFWHNAMWSERSNFVAIPTDCPQRDERMGWMGDAQVFWDAASFNMDTDAFTRHFMDDVRDSQNPSGAFAEVTPYPYAPYGAPGWADGGVILPWTAFQHYGDTRIIERNWDAMRRWIEYVLNANPDLIWRKKRGTDYGDWLAVDAKSPGDPTTPKDLIGTAFWARSTSLMSKMAKATNRADDAAHYGKLEEGIRDAFQKAFVRADGSVGNGSQTSYVLPLAFDLLPRKLRPAAARHLAADIRKRGTHVSTGFLGTPYILDALASSGLEALAVELLIQTSYPSWGYMVMKGATTMWERWNSDTGDVAMNSYNHYAFGAVVGFMYRRLAGIEAGMPGFKEIVIRPICDPKLKRAGGDYNSVVGRISTEWRRDGDQLELDATIPANASATIHIPAMHHQTVREGGRTVAAHDGIRVQSRTKDRMIVSVGSGDYRFAVL